MMFTSVCLFHMCSLYIAVLLTSFLESCQCSFPALSCEFASVDVSDVLGTVTFISLLLLIACDPQLVTQYYLVKWYFRYCIY